MIKTLAKQNGVREYLSLPQRSRLLYSCFTLDIIFSPKSISGFLDSELFRVLARYLNRFGVEAHVMSVVFYRDNQQKWRMQVLYTFKLDENYDIVISKHNKTPFYSTGKAQLERLQNELNQLNYRSKVVDTSLSIISREVFEHWGYVTDNHGIKFSSYIVKSKNSAIRTLDAVFNRTRTGHIVLHCQKNPLNEISVLGVVTIQGKRRSKLEEKINSQENFFSLAKLRSEGSQEHISGLYLCKGEQGKALHAYHPLYIVTELTPEQRSYLAFDLNQNRVFDASDDVAQQVRENAAELLSSDLLTQITDNNPPSYAISS